MVFQSKNESALFNSDFVYPVLLVAISFGFYNSFELCCFLTEKVILADLEEVLNI